MSAETSSRMEVISEGFCRGEGRGEGKIDQDEVEGENSESKIELHETTSAKEVATHLICASHQLAEPVDEKVVPLESPPTDPHFEHSQNRHLS